MAYVKTTWVNGPAGGTPVNATNLNNLEDAVEATDIQVTTNTADIAAIQSGTTGWVDKTFADLGGVVAVGDKVFANTTGGAFNLVLPTGAVLGDTVFFSDVAGNFATANFSVTPESGGRIMGGTIDEALVLVTNYDFVELVYSGNATYGWIVTAKP